MNISFKLIVFLSIITITFCSWLCCFRQIVPDTSIKGCQGNYCTSSNCFGKNCTTTKCTGFRCFAGDCTGENCKAGDCYGRKCKAGDCYGHNCKPGICFDPNCDPKTCPQINKRCRDGKVYKINRPFYYGFTQDFINGTYLNPPLCDDITVKDLYNGEADSFGLHTVNLYGKGSYTYPQIVDPSLKNVTNIDDNDIVISSYPMIKKNFNCKIVKSR